MPKMGAGKGVIWCSAVIYFVKYDSFYLHVCVRTEENIIQLEKTGLYSHRRQLLIYGFQEVSQ